VVRFKWKIGVLACGAELAILQQLCQDLPSAARLRLDANGGLSLDAAQSYLTLCDRLGSGEIGAAIEFLEQPLPPSEFAAMQDLAQRYLTPLALDESVATLPDLQRHYQRGWRGLFVIKPAIAGSPTQLRQFCQTTALDVVFSSALETAIGRAAGLQLAAELATGDRAQGYGTTHWFQDHGFQDQESEDFEQLWQSLA
jgi:o-succinylbenzoate synthase